MATTNQKLTGCAAAPYTGQQGRVAVSGSITQPAGIGGVPPSFSAAPVILGTPTVGVPVAYQPGDVSGTPTPTRTRQWLLDGGVIPGATNSTYTPVAGDVGTNRLSVRETATNIAGVANSTSAAVSVAGAAGETITTVALTSSVGGSSLPFVFGQAFKQGHVPSGSTLGGDSAVQVTTKNTWPDGSLKYAIVSGRRTLTANVASTLTLRINGSVSGGAALTTTDLRATGITASIAYGAYGSVSWANTDWDAPFQTLTSGPEFSSWTYRRAIGSDAHLVGWLEVRLYAGGAVSALAWIENCYLSVASPGERSGTATFTLSGVQRFSQALTLLNHQRAILASGWPLEHWLGTDPSVTPAHDAAYLQATKLVPAYRANSVGSSSLIGRLSTTYTPLAQTDHQPIMTGPGSDGYHPAIGLLPEWDVAYLTMAGDVRAYKACLINSANAGRYGIHYRDQTTNRPLRFSSYPNLVMEGDTAGIPGSGASSTSAYTPAATGGAPPLFGGDHHPSFGFMAYLVSGWNWFLEELQLLATGNYLRNSDTNRQNSGGVFQSDAGSDITRGAAWSTRTLAQAACLTPDADTNLRNEFVSSINQNINWYHGRYVAQPNNPLGLLAPYDHYNDNTPANPWQSAIWMDDFFTATYGYLKDLAVHGSAFTEKLNGFTEWKYRSIVGRLGAAGSSFWSYRYVEQYTVYYAPRNDSNWSTGAGPWYADWGAVARAMGIPTDAAAGASLVGSYVNVATGYTSNYQPAIAYAVDHSAAGAAAAYARLTSASNWATHVATYTNDPVWGVKPHTTAAGVALTGGASSSANASASLTVQNLGAPAYMSGVGQLTWATISGNTPSDVMVGYPSPGNSKVYICAYSGGAHRASDTRFFLAGGGHSDYAGNEIPYCTLSADAPAWVLSRFPSTSANVGNGIQVNGDGRMASRHTYWNPQFDDTDNRLMFIGGGALWGDPPPNSPRVWGWDPTTFDYENQATYPSQNGIDGTGLPCGKDGSGNVWIQNAQGDLFRWNRATKTWTSLGTKTVCNIDCALVYDPQRNRMVRFDGSFPRQYDMAGNETTVSFTGSAASHATNGRSVTWCGDRNSFLICPWGGTAVYEAVWNGSSYVVSALSIGGTPPPSPPGDGTANLYGRFFWSAQLHAVFHLRSYSDNWRYFRTGNF